MARFSTHKSMLIRIEKLKRRVQVDTQRMRGKNMGGRSYLTKNLYWSTIFRDKNSKGFLSEKLTVTETDGGVHGRTPFKKGLYVRRKNRFNKQA